jgi:drug/metabolite transporter (DMT)-like permease
MYCIFFALNHLQLGEAVLLSFTSPVFIPLVAYWWLKESVSMQTRLAIVIGFLGVALILKPGAGVFRIAAIVGLMAGVMMAIGQVGIRRLSKTEPAVRIVFYFTLISTVVSAIPLLWSWQKAPVEIWVALIGMGLLAVIGQVMMTNGYRLAPAARIGPISYANVLFSTFLGWFFWNESLDPLTWIGAVLICLAGIMTSYQRDTIVAVPGTVHTVREHFVAGHGEK